VDTIFALSSGRPSSGVAVVRISGPAAFSTLSTLTGRDLPEPRQMSLRKLKAADDTILDHALVVRFVAPHSVTGEDMVELHLHGGIAVVAAVMSTLTELGLESASAGAFTRQAFDRGKIDLGQVEALGDLVAAETDGQRRAALARTGSALADRVDGWRTTLIETRAELEATLDFTEEEEVPAALSGRARAALASLADALAAADADGRRGELIRDGLTIVIVGPVNAGKSTLLNALARRDVAMVSPLPGTTRDVIEVRANLGGQLVILVDTAGVRETTDPLEREGIRRATARAASADLIIDLGPTPAAGTIAVVAKSDRAAVGAGWHDGRLHVSAQTGDGLALLEAHLTDRVMRLVDVGEPPVVAHAHQRKSLRTAKMSIEAALAADDGVIVADELRAATVALAMLIGRVAPEQLLDEIFARFCIGK